MTWEAWKAPHAAGLGSLWSLEVESLWKLEAQGCIGWKGWDSSFPASGRMLAPACCGIWDCTLDAFDGAILRWICTPWFQSTCSRCCLADCSELWVDRFHAASIFEAKQRQMKQDGTHNFTPSFATKRTGITATNNEQLPNVPDTVWRLGSVSA